MAHEKKQFFANPHSVSAVKLPASSITFYQIEEAGVDRAQDVYILRSDNDDHPRSGFAFGKTSTFTARCVDPWALDGVSQGDEFASVTAKWQGYGKAAGKAITMEFDSAVFMSPATLRAAHGAMPAVADLAFLAVLGDLDPPDHSADNYTLA
jgi:hypothetical protein